MRFTFTILFFLFFPVLSFGQEHVDSAIPEIAEILATPPDAVAAGAEDPFGFILPMGFEPDEATKASIQEAVRSFYDYRTEAFQHRLKVFWWQYFSSQIIFFVVIIIVGVGLYFSWLQFHATKRRSSETATTFEASMAGFKISSPILGVIILVLSLVFFYLYLVHIYPVKDVF